MAFLWRLKNLEMKLTPYIKFDLVVIKYIKFPKFKIYILPITKSVGVGLHLNMLNIFKVSVAY